MEAVSDKLHQYLEDAVNSHDEKLYLKTGKGDHTYGGVYKMAVIFKKILFENGIEKNDRVVVYSSKNSESVAMMFACSMCECIYVPVSSINPPERTQFIIENTTACFLLCDHETGLELSKINFNITSVYHGTETVLYKNTSEKLTITQSNDAAFILFTSGSTGLPKGVVISHSAAIAFVDWAAKEFQITENDVLSSIAPFNFDLSVFDIFVSVKMKTTLCLYSEAETKNAMLMAQKISLDGITTIYATPTFYSTLANFGKLKKYDFTHLNNVLFAGEIFQLESFKHLLTFWPDKNYFNLFGPTETNVCTFYKVDLQKTDFPVFPIGKPCYYAVTLLLDENGTEINEKNITAELLVAGKSLFNEYWRDGKKKQEAFYSDSENRNYYKTGDLVYVNDDGDYVYVSRKDRMIKKNGFRIEPHEIERIMLLYPGTSNAAVLFSKTNNQITCFLENKEGEAGDFLSIKNHCQKFLPLYMVPDNFVFLNAMPQTSSGKVDLQALNNQL